MIAMFADVKLVKVTRKCALSVDSGTLVFCMPLFQPMTPSGNGSFSWVVSGTYTGADAFTGATLVTIVSLVTVVLPAEIEGVAVAEAVLGTVSVRGIRAPGVADCDAETPNNNTDPVNPQKRTLHFI